MPTRDLMIHWGIVSYHIHVTSGPKVSEQGISTELRQFILEAIDSVAQVEALLLCRASADIQWTTATVSKRLYISEMEAASLLDHLTHLRLLKKLEGENAHYVYSPGSADLAALVDQLAHTYAKQLVPVSNLIHSKQKTKIQQFADAFRFRKDEP
jgi:hypothetical protein